MTRDCSRLLWTIVPASQTVDVGDSLTVEVVVSGLEVDGPASVGAFDFDIAFSASQLAATSVTFGPFLGNPAFFDALTVAVIDNAAGLVDVAEVSLLSPSALAALQPGAFSLVTLNFIAIAPGTSPFTFLDIQLDDPVGNPLEAVAGAGSVAVVFEPSTALLLGLAVAGFVGITRRRRRLAATLGDVVRAPQPSAADPAAAQRMT